MKISDFHQIARQEGRVVLDSKSKEVKTQSLKGRIVSFFKGKSEVRARSAEVKQAFLKAIKESGGRDAAERARQLLGPETKPLTARDVRKVLQETTTVVRTNLPIRSEIRETVQQALRDILSPMIEQGTLNRDAVRNALRDLDIGSREAQALVALGKRDLPGVVGSAFPELNESQRKWVENTVSEEVKWGFYNGLDEIAGESPELRRFFNLQAGDLTVTLGDAGFRSSEDLDLRSEKFSGALDKLVESLSEKPPGRLLDGLATASADELRQLVMESLLSLEEKSSPERQGIVEQRLADEGVGRALDRIVESLRAGIPSVRSGGEGPPGTLALAGEEYERGELLGQGGNGRVYRYHSEEKGDLVVKQMLNPKKSSAVDEEVRNHRFVNEATTGDGVPYTSYFSKLEAVARDEEGRLYIVLKEEPNGSLGDLIKGRTLEKAVEAGTLAPAEAIQIKKSVALHLLEGATIMRNELGMMHRDVKPDNIFISEEGHPKFADFGESIQVSVDPSGVGTKTPEYMDAESGEGAKDVSDDAYALAISIYQLMTGRFPIGEAAERGEHISRHGGLKLEGEHSTGDEGLDQILFDLTRTDVSQRPTVEDVLLQPCFDEVRESKNSHLAKLPEIINA